MPRGGKQKKRREKRRRKNKRPAYSYLVMLYWRDFVANIVNQTEALEKLIETGWVRPTTASNATSPEISDTPVQQDAAVDPMLQQDALQDADVTHQLYNPAIPQNQPSEHMDEDEIEPQARLQMQAPPTPALPREDEPLSVAHAGMMAGVTANGSNAFEGALDGSNFVGLGGLEPFGMDSSSWYTGDWMDPDPSRHGGLL